MFRAAPRIIVRSATARVALPRCVAPGRRYLSTAPPSQKSRSWKSLVARFGIAGTIIYYYNTTDVFAEEPRHPVQALPETEVESETLPTIESISAERQKRKSEQAQLNARAQNETQSPQRNAPSASGSEGGIEGLEEEADQQGAFNPETGEINWDCPCLGGMANGPCGEQFRAAFSCFIYSEEEPKGVDCIDKFKEMQNCFREYPEIYGAELDPDAADDDEDDVAPSDLPTPSDANSSPPSSTPTKSHTKSQPQPHTSETGRADKGKMSSEPSSRPQSLEKGTEAKSNFELVPDSYKPDAKSDTQSANQAAQQSKSQEPVSESEALVPKAAHDAGDANTKVLERK